MHTDASAQGLAAILLQKQSDGALAPIAFYSQTTNQVEVRYHNFELQMLAIARAMEKFHIYLFGLEFTVVTDCNALVYAVNKATLNPRIARWTLSLQNYKCKVIHRLGRRIIHLNALSRQVMYISQLTLEQELEYKQLQDSKIKEIALELEYKDSVS